MPQPPAPLAPPAALYALLVVLVLLAPGGDAAGAGASWRDLGPGGCREAGGRCEKRAVERGLPDVAACRQLCEADAECTATVFGQRDNETFCHLLVGGPYTHADNSTAAGARCSVREMRCVMPRSAAGYDVGGCGTLAAAGEPPCPVRCGTNYVGEPTARCRREGGEFEFDGCASLSPMWELHGQGSCLNFGAGRPHAAHPAASRMMCQATCEANGDCSAVSYDADQSRCDLFPLAPPPLVPYGAPLEGVGMECWRMGQPSAAAEATPAPRARTSRTNEVLVQATVACIATAVAVICLVTIALFVRHICHLYAAREEASDKRAARHDAQPRDGGDVEAGEEGGQTCTTTTTAVEPFSIPEADFEKPRGKLSVTSRPSSHSSDSTRASTPQGSLALPGPGCPQQTPTFGDRPLNMTFSGVRVAGSPLSQLPRAWSEGPPRHGRLPPLNLEARTIQPGAPSNTRVVDLT